MELLVIFYWIFALIICVCFFMLCTNVSKIKKKLLMDSIELRDEYRRHVFFGDIDRARESYKQMFFAEYQKIGYGSKNQRQQEYEQLKERFRKLDELGIVAPEMIK